MQLMSSDADHAFVEYATLFNPASTTYVKHFIANNQIIKTIIIQYVLCSWLW
jgi:hypothetical protein